MAKLAIFTTSRFSHDYARASPLLQRMAETAVHDFVRRARADVTTVASQYPRVKGVGRNDILEIDISKANRLTAHWSSPELTLLAVGGHATTPFTRRLKLETLVSEATTAPKQFWPSSPSRFFVRRPDSCFSLYGSERTREWAYFLDDEQAGITESIFESITSTLTDPSTVAAVRQSVILRALEAAGVPVPDEGGRCVSNVHLVIGGPGTGKTCILLNLLKRLVDSGEDDIHLGLSPKVSEYIQRSLGLSVDRFGQDADSAQVLLIDDPATAGAMDTYCTAKGAVPVAVVLAVDPLQMTETLRDEAFDSFVHTFNVTVHELHSCYRQKQNVGESAKKVADAVASSTPYLAAHKIEDFRRGHERLTRLANGLRFPNPRGYTDVIEGATVSSLKRELDRIKRYAGGMWSHWPSLLVAVIDPDVPSLTEDWSSCLQNSGVTFEVVTPDELDTPKGVEYQHAFVVTGPKLYAQLEDGFEGTGQSVYAARRRLRIPFSRAKDSLVVLVPSQSQR